MPLLKITAFESKLIYRTQNVFPVHCVSNSTIIQKRPSHCVVLTHLASEQRSRVPAQACGNELCPLTSLKPLSHHPEAALLLE